MAAILSVAALLLGVGTPTASAGDPSDSAPPPSPLYISSPSSTELFVNVTASAGVAANDTILDPKIADKERQQGFMNGGRGACLVDIDSDGDDDIYVVGPGRNQMFRNDVNLTFTDITNSSRTGDTGYGMACVSGDLDNDGYQDIIATNYYSHFAIYKNNRNSTFTNVTDSSGIDDTGPQAGVALGDFDNDGLLDIFLAEYVKTNDRVYRNLGNFKFQDRTSRAGIQDLDFGFQPIIFDYDSDGLQDVYVANDFGLDMMWKNMGNFSFRDVSRATGAMDTRGGMGVDAGDFDRDGDIDFYVGNYEENGLWENQNGRFADVGNSSGTDNSWTTWGVAFLDYDLDGREDLYVANGNVEIGRDFHQPNALYRNLGNGSFEDVSEGSGANDVEVSRGLAVGDLNDDGRIDLYVVNMNCPAALLKNVVNTTNSWLKVRLQGTVSNRDGVGAVVTAVAGATKVTKPLLAGATYLSSNSKTLVFGLGNATGVDQLLIQWPSGLLQTISNPGINKTVKVVEEDKELPVAVAPDLVVNQGIPFELNGTSSTDNVRIVQYNWTVVVNGTVKTGSGAVTIMIIYTPGTFPGSLRVKDPFANIGETTFTVTVRPHAAVTIDIGPDISVPEGGTVNLLAKGSSTVTPNYEADCTFEWWFVDAGVLQTMSGSRPSYTFRLPGVIEVFARVTDPSGTNATDSMRVTVLDAVAPVISASVPAEVDEDVPALFDASATTDNDPAFGITGGFTWSYEGRSGRVTFMDRTTSHAFPDPGTFALVLTVRDSTGNAASRVYTVVVHDHTPPVADAGPDKTTLPGEEVTLSAASSTDNDVRFPREGTFEWTIFLRTGPLTLSGATQVLRFPEPGLFRVELRVADPSGNFAEAPAVVHVHVLDTEPPVPAAGGDQFVSVGDTLVLDGSKSTDNDPTLLLTSTFVWEFQDGPDRVKLVGLTQSYTFQRAGEYRARLTVIDAAGNSAAVLFTIRVGDARAPEIVTGPIPAKLVAGDILTLDASGTTDNVGVASIGWQVTGPYAFNHLIDSAQGSVRLEIPGTYNATVTARDAVGNTATRSFIVEVLPRPPDDGGAGGGGENPPPGGDTAGTGGGTGPGPATPTGPTAPSLSVLPLIGILAGAAAVVSILGLRRRAG